MAFPSYDVVAGRLSAVAYPESRAGNLTDPQKVFAELALRNLVIYLVLNAMDGEDPGVGLGVLGDYPIIRFDLRRCIAATEWRILAARRLGLSWLLRFSFCRRGANLRIAFLHNCTCLISSTLSGSISVNLFHPFFTQESQI